MNVVFPLLRHPRVDLGRDIHQMVHPVLHTIPFFTRTPFRISHDVAQGREMVVVHGVENHVAVLGLHAPHRGRAIGHPAPRGVVVARTGEARRDHGQNHLLQRDVDELSAPRLPLAKQRPQGRGCRRNAAVVPDEVPSGLYGRTGNVDRARWQQVSEARGVDEGQFVAGGGGSRTGRPVGRDARVNEPGIQSLQGLPIEAGFVQLFQSVAIDEDVGAFEERREGLSVRGID